MTRRRLVLIAVAAAALGAAWWWFATGLSAEERRLEGTWRYHDTTSGRWTNTLILVADRQYWDVPAGSRGPVGAPPDGRWSIRGGELVVDLERSAIRRLGRPLAGAIGVRVAPAVGYPLASVTMDEVIVVGPDGSRRVWTRAPAD
jgi:hypothetical protein